MTLEEKKEVYPQKTVALLIFLGGFTNNIIPTLITFLHSNYNFEHWKAVLLQSTFFINFFITVIPGWMLIKKHGYEKTIRYSLILCAISSTFFAFALETKNNTLIFPVIFLLAIGITLIRISVTPLLIGNQVSNRYHKNISLIMCADTIGALISPTLSSYWLLNAQNNWTLQPSTCFFLKLGIIYLLLARYVQKKPLGNNNHTSTTINKTNLLNAMKKKNIQSGFFATFTFIGLEFSIPIFIALIAQKNTPDNPHIGAVLISCYWTLLLIGRLVSTKILQIVSASNLIMYGAVISIFLIITTINTTYFAYSLTILGLINSYMYPCIFSIHTKNLPKTEHFIASSIFLMGFSGGAAIPFMQALLSKSLGTHGSFILIIICYISLTAIIQTNKKHQAESLEKAAANLGQR
ncbi:MAG: MFS transporter [Pseudomonadota bacterium]|nr:MFS transporter [Pseudomonadota bacterium]